MASQSYDGNQNASRNDSKAVDFPGKISVSSKDKIDVGSGSPAESRAKNVTMGDDSGSTLSIKNGKV